MSYSTLTQISEKLLMIHNGGVRAPMLATRTLGFMRLFSTRSEMKRNHLSMFMQAENGKCVLLLSQSLTKCQVAQNNLKIVESAVTGGKHDKSESRDSKESKSSIFAI